MLCVAAIVRLATNPTNWSDLGFLLLIILVVLYAIWLYLSPSRKKGMEAVASELGLRFFPVLSADEMGTRGASFVYGGIAAARNCMRGMVKGRDTVIFDQSMEGDPVKGNLVGPWEGTVVGFRVAADSFCRDRGVIQRTFWHVEKMGEWVFVYHTQPLVEPADIAAYVEQARVRFETATSPHGS